MLPAVLPLLTSLAPVLAKLVSGSDRAEAVTKTVSAAVERVAGIAPDTPEKVEKVRALIDQNPEMFVKLRTELQAIEQAELEAYLADRKDARARDLELHRLGDGNLRANIMLGMAFGAIVVITGALVLLNTFGEKSEFTGAIFGFLTGIGGMFARNVGSAFDFEFGSSRGSQKKSEQLQTMTDRMQTLQGQTAQGVVSGVVGGMAKAAPEAIEAVREAFEDDDDDLNRKSLSAFRKRMGGAAALPAAG
ncbi:hypothetical protein P2H44_08585 [Albimonas sp. CAU 1670]|uniref:hypothetical protein n=1 Tax=Albimonas sp. CAU 1670 TaxID=3032599 RepID=UPI0023DB7991|nr:hypothetical protein [Albimonas sp. CAU 1670]MDF2232606.1 hypothetical protein [Albimonas sp. CAU 1670]